MADEAAKRSLAHLEASNELRHEERGAGNVLRNFLRGDGGLKSIGAQSLETQFAGAQREWAALFRTVQETKVAYINAVRETKVAAANKEAAPLTKTRDEDTKRLDQRYKRCCERRTRCHLEYLNLIQKLNDLKPTYMRLMSEVRVLSLPLSIHTAHIVLV